MERKTENTGENDCNKYYFYDALRWSNKKYPAKNNWVCFAKCSLKAFTSFNDSEDSKDELNRQTRR